MAWVSLATIHSISNMLSTTRHGRALAYERVPLRAYQRIWARTHHDTLFRFDPRLVRKRATPRAIFRPLMEWVTPEMILEGRFLLTAFPAHIPYRARLAALRDGMKFGIQSGYIRICDGLSVPRWTFRPSPQWCRSTGIPERRWKESAVDHGQLALEAALSSLGSHGEFSTDGLTFEPEATSLSTSRCARTIRPGAELGAIADLITVDGTGARRATEVISENYRGANIAAKYDGLEIRVDLVATSIPVARRVVAATGAPCLHF